MTFQKLFTALLVAALWSSHPENCMANAMKRLVLFAGPHRTGSASVEEFFHKYCHGSVRHDKEGFPLRAWKWPQVETTHFKDSDLVPMYKIFQNLVVEPRMDDPLNQDIMAAIKDAWDTADSGIILGTELFDQIGAYAQHDGMEAMRQVVKAVGLENDPEYVTVVVNYRSPRFDHWESVWKGSVEGTGKTYKEFMCHTRQYHEKLELISTALNPLQIATESQKEGWHVAIMDMAGLDRANVDVSHSIACNVMDAKCSQSPGWVNNHVDEIIHNNEAEDGHDLVELNDEQRKLAEELLEARDCAYLELMQKLKRDGSGDYKVYEQYSIWPHCGSKKDGTVYQGLLNPELVFMGLLTQLKCPDGVLYDTMPKSINDILDGKFGLAEPSETSPGLQQPVYTQKKKKRHPFLWLLLLIGVYAGYSIYKNGGRVPVAWLGYAQRAQQIGLQLVNQVVSRFSGGGQPTRVSTTSPEAELEAMEFSRAKTSLSGGVL